MTTDTLVKSIMPAQINVVLAEDAIKATASSSDLVKSLNAHGLRVFCVNTVYNLRTLNAMLRKRHGPDFSVEERSDKLYYFSSEQHGELGKSNTLLYNVGWDNYDVVIVTTWEMAARAYRYREQLIYNLCELSERGLTVIVYSTATTDPHAGRTDRGGIGRLSIVSANIVAISRHYTSNIGLTTQDIREAAREAWPQAYEEYAREQVRKQRAKEAVESAEGVARHGSRVTENEGLRNLRGVQLSDWKITELGVVQSDPGMDAERPTLHSHAEHGNEESSRLSVNPPTPLSTSAGMSNQMKPYRL